MSSSTKEVDYRNLDTLNYPEMGLGPVAVEPYVCAEYADLEREKIFSKSWLLACHESEIPNSGDFLVKDIGILKASLIFSRGADGIVRAFHNVCTHRGNQLVMDQCKGRAKNCKFVCKFHGWVFGSDGRLIAPTDPEHFFDLDKEKLGLTPVSVDIWKGWIFFNGQQKPSQSLRVFLGSFGEALECYPSEQLEMMACWSGEVKANWKVVMDGFQEAYHEVAVHTRTSPEMHSWAANPYARHAYFQAHGPHRRLTIGVNPQLKSSPTATIVGELLSRGRSPASGTGEQGMNPGNIPNFHFDLNGVFPNTLIIPFSGACATMEFIPIAADKSQLTVKFYAQGEISWSQRIGWERPIIFYREAVLEDLTVMEATQKGLSSGAIKEIYFSDGEIGARHLIHAVDSVVRG